MNSYECYCAAMDYCNWNDIPVSDEMSELDVIAQATSAGWEVKEACRKPEYCLVQYRGDHVAIHFCGTSKECLEFATRYKQLYPNLQMRTLKEGIRLCNQ